MAFADKEGGTYNVHITDDLKSHGTWEYIDFKFTLPHSCYILFWRRDESKFTRDLAKSITKYVRDDLKDFIDEGKWNGSTWHQKIRQKLVNANTCLVLAWDEMVLPEQYYNWKEFSEIAYDISKEESKVIMEPGSTHDRELDIYDGKIDFNRQNNPILDSYSTRSTKYTGYKIPSDEVIKKYATEMWLENYEEANVLLSKHYNIFPATIDTKRDAEEFVKYDFVNHTITFNLSKLSELDKRIPALFLGFFKHLSCVNDWRFDEDPFTSMAMEKTEAEKFSFDTIQRMLEIGIDPR